MLTPPFSVLLSCVSVTCGTWSMSLCFKSCAECLVPLHPSTAGLRVFRARLALRFPQGAWRPVRPSTGMALCSEHVLSALPGGEAGSDGPHEPSPPLLNFPWCHKEGPGVSEMRSLQTQSPPTIRAPVATHARTPAHRAHTS